MISDFDIRNKTFLSNHSPEQAAKITKDCIRFTAIQFYEKTLKKNLDHAFRKIIGFIPTDEEKDINLECIKNPLNKENNPDKWIHKWFYDGREIMIQYPVKNVDSKLVMRCGFPR